MTEVRWSKRAETDFNEIFDDLKRTNKQFASKFADRIRYLVQLISAYPQMGRIVPELNIAAFREVFWKKYRLIYRIRSELIEIITIYHGSRILDFS